MIVDSHKKFRRISSTIINLGQTGKTIINYHEEFEQV